MVMEAISIKLKQLRARMANLVLARKQVEQSDDRAYSNGKIASIDNDILYVKREIASWYNQHQLTFGDTKRLTLSKEGEYGFKISVADLSKPGVVKQIEVEIKQADAEDMVDYLGGRLVYFGGNYVDSMAAVAILKKENLSLIEERDSLRRLNQAAQEQIELLEAAMVTAEDHSAASSA